MGSMYVMSYQAGSYICHRTDGLNGGHYRGMCMYLGAHTKQTDQTKAMVIDVFECSTCRYVKLNVTLLT